MVVWDYQQRGARGAHGAQTLKIPGYQGKVARPNIVDGKKEAHQLPGRVQNGSLSF